MVDELNEEGVDLKRCYEDTINSHLRFLDFCQELYNTEVIFIGVKPLISPNGIREKGARQHTNPNGVELYAAKSIIGKVYLGVLKSENRF